MTLTNITKARSNFPLPPELREAIYGYLVGIKRDSLDEDWSEAPVRQFHTQIFKINRAIRDEAIGFLHRTHQFVHFAYLLPKFEDLTIAFDLPIITSPALQPIFDDSHVLSISAKVQYPADDGMLDEPKLPLESGTVFLLSQDLPALFDMLRTLALKTSMRFLYIGNPRDVGIDPHYHSSKAYTLRIDVTARETPFAEFQEDSQAAVLRKLRTIKGDVRASFHEFAAVGTSGLTTEAVMNGMRPTLVWLRAREWDVLDRMRSWQSRVNALATVASKTKLALASRVFELAAAISPCSHELQVPQRIPDPELERVHGYQHTHRIDMMLFSAQLALSRRAVRLADMQLEAFGEMDVVMSSQQWLHFMRLRLAINIISYAQALMTNKKLQEILDLTAEQDEASLGDEYLDRDIGLAKELLMLSKSRGLGSAGKPRPEFIERISVFALPLRVIDSLPPEDQLRRPQGLSGWEDVLHKAELSKQDKVKIQTMQQEHGLSETLF